MNFDWSETQEMIRDSLGDFMSEAVAPQLEKWDREQTYPAEVIGGLAELGLLGVLVPEEFGGAGLGFAELAAAVEQISSYNGSLGLLVANHNALTTHYLAQYASAEQKQKYLPKLVAGEHLGAFICIGKTQLKVAQKKDHLILAGNSAPTVLAAKANLLLVFASSDAKPSSSCYLLKKNMSGLVIKPQKNVLGCRLSASGKVHFKQVKISPESLIGQASTAHQTASATREKYNVVLGAVAVGIARGAISRALEYAKNREQFGAPLAKLQAIQWMLAESTTMIEAAQLLVNKAAFAVDRKQLNKDEGLRAKNFAAKASLKACGDALQIHGGYGYIKDYPVERYLRDAQFCAVC